MGPSGILNAGDLSAELVGADLRRVRWRGTEVINRLYGALRADDWATVPARISAVEVSGEPGRVRVSFLADHLPAMPFRWSGVYDLTSNALRATFTGEASAPLATNRVGWCVLHPLSQVGGTLTHSLNGQDTSLRLPATVLPQHIDASGNPQPAWGPFETMSIDAAGVRIRASFEGDLFESEDQRNWTDASFKTYSTPLSMPRPTRIDRGQVVSQRISLDFSPGTPVAGTARSSSAPTNTTWSAIVTPGTTEADAATALTLVDRLRAQVTPLDDPASVISIARAPGRPWELAVYADADTDWRDLASLVEDHPPEFVLVIPYGSTSGDPHECTPRSLLTVAADTLGRTGVAAVGGGTQWNFTELQRHPLDHLDVISCSYSPTVHADDSRSIAETLESYPAIVLTARQRAPHARFSVGPLRDRTMVDPMWFHDSCVAWARAGVDHLCPLPVADLVADGRVSPWGEALRRAR